MIASLFFKVTNMRMHLNKRLAAVESLVRQGSRAVDVGTDHAHLPVVLIQSGRCPFVIATDIIPGPVASAQKTVALTGLSAQIDVRLGDGLDTVMPDEADDVLIAGMGGENIVDILKKAPWVKSDHYHLVLQPMTRPEVLREYLLTNGFSIEQELSVTDHGHRYMILSARYTAAAPVTDPFYYHVGYLSPQTDRSYLEWLLTKMLHKANGMRRGGEEEKAREVEAMANRLRQFLENEAMI